MGDRNGELYITWRAYLWAQVLVLGALVYVGWFVLDIHSANVHHGAARMSDMALQLDRNQELRVEFQHLRQEMAQQVQEMRTFYRTELQKRMDQLTDKAPAPPSGLRRMTP